MENSSATQCKYLLTSPTRYCAFFLHYSASNAAWSDLWMLSGVSGVEQWNSPPWGAGLAHSDCCWAQAPGGSRSDGDARRLSKIRHQHKSKAGMMSLLIGESLKYSILWEKGQNLGSHFQFPVRQFPSSVIGYKIFIFHISSCVAFTLWLLKAVVLDVTYYPSPLLEGETSISKDWSCSV